MPNLDQTGPGGQGPMTGRRMGRCTNFGAGPKNKADAAGQTPDENLPENFQGRGFGFGRGGGRGRGGRGFGMGRQNRFRGGQ